MFKSAFVIISIAAFACASGASLPEVPPSVKALPAMPEWWPGVKISIDLSTRDLTDSVLEMKSNIDKKVKRGESTLRERREFIKSATILTHAPGLSDEDIIYWGSQVAYAYARMGDHDRAALEYSKVCDLYAKDWYNFHCLAGQYEVVGQTRYALQVYQFMLEEFRTNTMATEIASNEIVFLRKISRECKLTKPIWWNQFEAKPSWWTNINVILPPITSYQDGESFVANNFVEKDAKQFVKAQLMLSEFRIMDHHERERSYLGVAFAYAKTGDHHRAIEWAWKVPEEFSCDGDACTRALKLIASEFEKLGDTENAQNIEKLLPCFSKPIPVKNQ